MAAFGPHRGGLHAGRPAASAGLAGSSEAAMMAAVRNKGEPTSRILASRWGEHPNVSESTAWRI